MDAGQMAIVARAIDRMLQQHEPHPALVLDRHWNVVRTNEAAPRFFGSFIDLEMRQKPRKSSRLDVSIQLGCGPLLKTGKRSRPACCKEFGEKRWARCWMRNSKDC